MLPWDHQRTTAQHSTKQCHIASSSSALPAPGLYPFLSPRVPSAWPVEGRNSHCDGRELCLLRPCRCSASAKEPLKGISGWGGPPVPKSRIKIEAAPQMAWFLQLPRRASLSLQGRQLGAHWAGHLALECAACGVHLGWDSDMVTGAPQSPLAKQG